MNAFQVGSLHDMGCRPPPNKQSGIASPGACLLLLAIERRLELGETKASVW